MALSFSSDCILCVDADEGEVELEFPIIYLDVPNWGTVSKEGNGLFNAS